MLNFLYTYWFEIIGTVIMLSCIIYMFINFFRSSNAEKMCMVREWLLQAVILAEKEYGGGTGRLKLSAVYDKFVERFSYLAKIIPFETFSEYVDDALEEMRELLSSNQAIAKVVSINEDIKE